MMEDMGFFDHIYEELPADFTAVYEIARVLKNERHPLAQALHSALTMIEMEAAKEAVYVAEEELQIFHDDVEEYESDLIKSPQHLPRIYNYQWLLPEEVFYRKLAKKELWVPYARKPHYASVEPDPEGYHPDSRKQNVYLLLDTSSSMAMKNRINIAKAACYHFLKHNMRELGYISLRTFDAKIGDLHSAHDNESFQVLIQYIMRHHALGNGTAMAGAIGQAVADIRSMPRLTETEILIITDGACALDEVKMRELLGSDIKIHTIKIGKSQLYVSKSYIKDKLFEDDTAQHSVIERLQKRIEELRRLRNKEQSQHGQRSLDERIRHTEAELQVQINAMTEEIVVGYGHELERLSDVYVNIQDIDITKVIELDEDAIAELRRLLAKLIEDLEMHSAPEHLRQLALLGDHIAFLLKNSEQDDLHDALEDIHQQVLDILDKELHQKVEFNQSGLVAKIQPEERMDLRFLLEAQGMKGISLWLIIKQKLKALIRTLVRRIR
jgi:hypothetical protein